MRPSHRFQLVDEIYEAFYQAVASGHTDLLERILGQYPELDVDREYFSDLTVLYHACANGRWDTTVPLLVNRLANLDLIFRVERFREESIRSTILTEACRLGRFEDALRLIELGADTTLGVQIIQTGPITSYTQTPLRHICCMNFGHDTESTRMPEALKETEAQMIYRSGVIARLVTRGTSPDLKWDLY